MKRWIPTILLALVATPLLAAFPYHMNATTVNMDKVTGSYDSFNWRWAGYDTQSNRFVFDRDISAYNIGFKLSQQTDSGQLTYISTTNLTVATSNVTFEIANTNIPKSGSYQAELFIWTPVSTNISRTIAQGKITTFKSLYDEDDSTFPWPTVTNLTEYLTKAAAEAKYMYTATNSPVAGYFMATDGTTNGAYWTALTGGGDMLWTDWNAAYSNTIASNRVNIVGLSSTQALNTARLGSNDTWHTALNLAIGSNTAAHTSYDAQIGTNTALANAAQGGVNSLSNTMYKLSGDTFLGALNLNTQRVMNAGVFTNGTFGGWFNMANGQFNGGDGFGSAYLNFTLGTVFNVNTNQNMNNHTIYGVTDSALANGLVTRATSEAWRDIAKTNAHPELLATAANGQTQTNTSWTTPEIITGTNPTLSKATNPSKSWYVTNTSSLTLPARDTNRTEWFSLEIWAQGNSFTFNTDGVARVVANGHLTNNGVNIVHGPYLTNLWFINSMGL